jgi:hypothetical protein
VGHLGCFHNLAIVNSAAVNTDVQGVFNCNLIHIPLGICLGLVFLDHMVVYFLVIEEPPYCFP